MRYKKIRRLSNALLIIFGLLSGLDFVMCIGGGGILNDLYLALEEIQDLEKRNLLENPPENISEVAKREIKLVHNSGGLQKYINETHESVSQFEMGLVVFTALFILTLIIKIVYRKKWAESKQASSS